MRYELADYEWTAIKPMLPNKPRGDCINDFLHWHASRTLAVTAMRAPPATG